MIEQCWELKRDRNMNYFLPKKILIDAQLSLMLFEEDFAHPLFMLAKNNHDYFIQFISWITKINTIEDELRFIRHCKAEYDEGLSANYALYFEGIGIIGSIGFNCIEKKEKNYSEASIGYWLAPQFQGKGYMQKAFNGLIETAINTTDIRSFLIKTSTQNDKSIHLAMKNHFQFSKLEPNGFRIADKSFDLAIYQRTFFDSY